MGSKTIERTRSLAGSMRRQEYRRRDASRQGSQALRAWRLLLYLAKVRFISAIFSTNFIFLAQIAVRGDTG